MSEMMTRMVDAIRDATHYEIDIPTAYEAARAVLDAMEEPTAPMLDRFVSRALCVSVHGEGGWSHYARNQWQTMLAGALAD